MPTAIQSIPQVNAPFDAPLSDDQIDAQQDAIREAIANAAQHREVIESTKRQREIERNSGPIMINGVPHLPAPAPTAYVAQAFEAAMHAWLYHERATASGRDNAISAVEMIDETLAALGERKGPRAAALREYLSLTRSTVSNALAAFEALPGVQAELAAQVTAARASYAAAAQALHEASRSNAAERILALQIEEAGGREIDRAITEAVRAVAFPSLPDFVAFAEAKHSTADMARLPGKDPAPSLIARAIEAGARAPSTIADLWIAFEPIKPHALLEMRWLSHLEARGQ